MWILFKNLYVEIHTGNSISSVNHMLQRMTNHTVHFCLRFKWNFLQFKLCTLPLSHPLDTTEKTLSPSPLLLLTRHQSTLIKFPLSLLSRLNSPSSLSLSSYFRYSSPLIIFLALQSTSSIKSMCLWYWEAWNWIQCCRSDLISAE